MTNPSFYIYLIASLPMLHFGGRAPFSFEKFLEISSRYIPETDSDILKRSSISGEYIYEDLGNPTLNRWRDFDTGLRNELVKVRAGRKKLDAAKYIRHDGVADSSITHIAVNASRNPSMVEAERLLDEARWKALDEFAFGHYFDLDFLITYAHKLLMLERWDVIEGADRKRLLEEFLL